jgi:hypothetical protein
MKTSDNEIGLHDNNRIFLLNKLLPYSGIPVSGWIIVQVVEKFRISVLNPKFYYHAQKNPLLDPILMPFHPFPRLNNNFGDNAKITTAM